MKIKRIVTISVFVLFLASVAIFALFGPKIRAACEAAPEYAPGRPEILSIDDFYEAVHAAAERAKPGDVVLLSPASAAFDKFKNFMVRGAEFKKTVMEL